MRINMKKVDAQVRGNEKTINLSAGVDVFKSEGSCGSN